MGRLSCCVAVVTAALCFATSAAAQGRAMLRISVEDQLSGAIKGAKITLVNKASGTAREASTDKAGLAAFEGLGPGDYVLKAEAKGFRLLQRTVTVGATDPEPLKLKLEIEVTSEDVTVTGGVAPVPRTNADQNADTIKFGNGMLQGLPMLSDTLQLSTFINGFMSPLAGGGIPTIIVDGLEVTSEALPTGAIRQVVVNKNPYSPQYRQLGKARVEIITETGSTRHFNGNVGFTSTDSKFNARNAFAQQNPDTHKNFIETGFSGPIGRKLGTFLISSQHLSDRQAEVVNAQTLAGPVNSTVPLFLNSTTAFARADLRLSSADRLSINYNVVQSLERNVSVGGLRLPEVGIANHLLEQRVRVALDTKFSAAASNQLRVFTENEAGRVGNAATGPSLDVPGAFTGGNNPEFVTDKIALLEFRDTMSYFRRNHEIQFGGRLRISHDDVTDFTNFGGTFQFANLAQFSAGKAEVFTINQGNPAARFSRNEGDLFFQDEMKLRRDLTLLAGARYDVAAGSHDYNNVDPRLALAFAPGQQKTVFRVGTGLFYSRFSDRIRQESTLYDGVRIRQLVVENPSYPDPFGGQQSTIPPSVVRLDPALIIPHQFQVSASVERQLGSGTLVTVEYLHLRGYRGYRSRDVNAPLPGASVRPNPNYGSINQVESTVGLKGNSLGFTLNSRIGTVLKTSAIYTLTRAIDSADGPFSLPADNFNLAPEVGPASFDIRHKFNLAGVATLPRGFQAGVVANISSGPPFDILTGFDDNGDGAVLDRPLGVTRNTGRSPGYASVDLRLTKVFLVSRPAWAGKDVPSRLTINIDAFNVLNRTNLDKAVDVQSSPLFGKSIAALDPRIIQLSLKYFF